MEALFLKILNMSLSAAAVICVVLLVRLALRRAPKKWSYLLWAVVAFRLLCPVSFSAPFSVLRLATQPAAVTGSAESAASTVAYIPQDIGYMAEPRVYVGTPAVSEAVSASLPAATPADSANPLQIWVAVGTGLWCLGMAVLLCYGIISYVNLRRRLRDAVRVEDGVFETDAVRSPFILGLFYPTVYLPVGLAGEPLRYVLAHERFHIRHGDHAVKLLAFALLCVHWFNPLVWLAFTLMSRDMEMRCDEAVLAAEHDITKPYSMALLSFATARRFPSPSPLCFGETGVRGRIKNVLRWKKPRVWVTVLCALLCAVAVAACAANPDKAETGEPRLTPWNWTNTVTVGDIRAAEWNGAALTADQRAELVRLLNGVGIDEVIRGRGIPSQNVLDITAGVGYRLRWAGGIIELDFDDNAAATELYGIPDILSPGVWEIHNDALYAFLEGLRNAEDLPLADGLYSAAYLVEKALNSDGAEAEAVQYLMFQRLRLSPAETLETIGARPEGIRDWLCWMLSAEVKQALEDGTVADAAELVADAPLAGNGTVAWGKVADYVNHEQPAPKSWRQVYLDFYYSLDAETLYGAALMDIDFDSVPELMIWDGVASGAATGVLYRNDGTRVTRTSERIFSTNILRGHATEQPFPLKALWAFWLVREWETGDYYWAVHSGNGQDGRVWGSYVVFDGTDTEIAPYDSANAEDQAAAWEAFISRYEIMDIDYSDFTLSIYTDPKLDGAAFNALLNRWRPVRVFATGETPDAESPAEVVRAWLACLGDSDYDRYDSYWTEQKRGNHPYPAPNYGLKSLTIGEVYEDKGPWFRNYAQQLVGSPLAQSWGLTDPANVTSVIAEVDIVYDGALVMPVEAPGVMRLILIRADRLAPWRIVDSEIFSDIDAVGEEDRLLAQALENTEN